jgi:MazG family protein
MISTSPGGRSAIQTADDQVENWESIKKQEKADKGHSSILDDVPVGLPAMVRAQKLTKRAARVGFDWTEIDDIFAKLQEEIGELREEISPSRERGDNQRIEEELGDLLFVCANLARHLKLDGETALRKANQKFSRRFRYIEDALAKQNKKWEDTSLEAMEALWAEAKENEA